MSLVLECRYTSGEPSLLTVDIIGKQLCRGGVSGDESEREIIEWENACALPRCVRLFHSWKHELERN